MATSFNMEQAIEKHIATLASAGTLLPDDVKELTSHLMEAVATLTQQGLSEEEAFIIATKRLGTRQQLANEYGKVNPSMQVNGIWAPMIFGFATLTGLWWLGTAILAFVYGGALANGGVPRFPLFSVVVAHVALCVAIGVMVYHKRAMAAFLQRKLQRQPLFMLVGAGLLMATAAWAKHIAMLDIPTNIRFIALYEFHDPYIEFTFCLLLFMLFVGVASMLFTVKNPERATLKHLFSRPSIGVLLVAGWATELLAASTRVLPPHDTALIAGVYFGAVYFVGAFAISHYNRVHAFRYLCWYGILGLVLEVSVGVQADLSRLEAGFPMRTPYFVVGLLAGLAGGYFAGRSKLSVSMG